jgi:hypothetical protein
MPGRLARVIQVLETTAGAGFAARAISGSVLVSVHETRTRQAKPSGAARAKVSFMSPPSRSEGRFGEFWLRGSTKCQEPIKRASSGVAVRGTTGLREGSPPLQSRQDTASAGWVGVLFLAQTIGGKYGDQTTKA